MKTQGFHAHLSIAVADDETRTPLGTLEVQPFVHRQNVGDEAGLAFWAEEGGLYDNERQRWFDSIRLTEAAIRDSGASCIHVTDREADSYPMFAWLQQEGIRHVIRVSMLRRRLHGDPGSLNDALSNEPFVAEAEVFLGARGPLRSPRKLKKQPARKARKATLQFRAKEITIGRGSQSGACFSPIPKEGLPKTLKLNLVEVVERDPPEGEEPVRWLLITSEPITTVEQIIRVVDIYRKRWIIEEFNKSLKTGCGLEARQMESAETVLKVLAMLLPVAWRLLLLRSLDETSPNEPWQSVLEPLAFHILREAVPKAKLGKNANVRQVVLAIASLGGHIRRNGTPGWQSLHHGWRKLSDYVHGAQLAHQYGTEATHTRGVPADQPGT